MSEQKGRQGPDNTQPSSEKLVDAGTSTGRLVLRMLGLAWSYRLQTIRLILTQMCLLGFALSGLGLATLGVDVIADGVVEGAPPPRYPMGVDRPETWSKPFEVLIIGLVVLGIASLRFGLDRISHVWRARLVQDIVLELRAKVYDKLQRLSFQFFDANESGSIINRVTADVQAVRMFIDGVLVQVLMIVISLSFFLTFMLNIHVWLTLACLGTTPALWFLAVRFSKVVRPAYRRNRELMDRAVRVISENIQAVNVIKGFSRQAQEVDKFRTANRDVRDQKRWIFWRIATYVPLISFIPQCNLVILLMFGGWIYIHDPEFRIGQLLFFAGLLQQFSAQVGNIAQVANSMQQSLTGAQRVFEVLDAPVQIDNPENPAPLQRARGEVSFENVSYWYPDTTEPAIVDIDLHVEPGQCVAILGATGAGKSTMLHMIPRFHDPTSGRVLIDGVDLRNYEVNDLRRNVGVVFQESFLFSTTVAENIAFGHPDATAEQIERAARIAAAHEFIMEMEHGYDTIVGERGSNLSGGQRQRLAIARAVLLEPPILILDDPTAAIDPQTEHEILLAMDQAMRGRTTFVVAHRLSTLRRANQVIVLDQGRIVERGTHEQLMNRRGHYRRAAGLQLADEESRRLLGIEEAV